MRELLAEILLELNELSDALAGFENALAFAPNLFRSVYGLAASAEAAGDHDVAQKS